MLVRSGLSAFAFAAVAASFFAAQGCGPSQAGEGQSAGIYRAAAFSSTLPAAAAFGPGDPGTPDVVVMNRLDGRFDGSRFAHKAHSDMALMGDGCALCHHNPPPKQATPSCGLCHTGPLDEKTSGRLGFKGAVHAQCMGCHEECGVGGDCLLCHGRKGETAAKKAEPWPRTEQPAKKVYQTPRDGGDRVSFDHKNHVKECGPCSSCHRSESCGVCHGPASSRAPRPKAADHHAKCMNCHGKGKDREFECSDCHAR